MFTSIGMALGQPTARQDRQPVRRHSRPAGRCEGVFWRRTDRQEVRRIVLAARRYELTERPRGRRNGPLGHIALEVLEYLSRLVCFRTGRLEPSVGHLMEKLRRSKSAIHEALNALRTHGFLDRLRRYEPTGREGRGPQVRQISNAYRLVLPPRAARLIGGSPPLPDDVAQSLAEGRACVEAMKAEMPLDELAVFEVDDSSLGRALAQMGRNVQERESHGGTHTRTTNPCGAGTAGQGSSERPPNRPPERGFATRSES